MVLPGDVNAPRPGWSGGAVCVPRAWLELGWQATCLDESRYLGGVLARPLASRCVEVVVVVDKGAAERSAQPLNWWRARLQQAVRGSRFASEHHAPAHAGGVAAVQQLAAALRASEHPRLVQSVCRLPSGCAPLDALKRWTGHASLWLWQSDGVVPGVLTEHLGTDGWHQLRGLCFCSASEGEEDSGASGQHGAPACGIPPRLSWVKARAHVQAFAWAELQADWSCLAASVLAVVLGEEAPLS